MVNTAQAREYASVDIGERRMLPLRTLHSALMLNDGDLVLFRNKPIATRLQRMFTGAEVDHVAIISHALSSERGQYTLHECTADGVCSFPLATRLHE